MNQTNKNWDSFKLEVDHVLKDFETTMSQFTTEKN